MVPTPAMDPEIAAVMETLPPLPETLSADMLLVQRDETRRRLEALTLSDEVLREDVTVPGPSVGEPGVVLRVHRPVGLTAPAPCLYSMHGGGYVMGHHRMDDLRFDRWCPQLGCIGISVAYRLAPETTFPGPLADCYAGLEWVIGNAGALDIDASRIGIGGVSAGGGLAAALAILARDRGDLPPVAFQMLAYPMLDDRQMTTSSGWNVPRWTPTHNAFGWRSYLGPLYGRSDVPSLAAPARANDLSGLPPALVFVGSLDGFCDEDVLYAMRLYQAGVPTELHVYPGAPHGFDGLAPGTEIAKRCNRDALEWLARAFG